MQLSTEDRRGVRFMMRSVAGFALMNLVVKFLAVRALEFGSQAMILGPLSVLAVLVDAGEDDTTDGEVVWDHDG